MPPKKPKASIAAPDLVLRIVYDGKTYDMPQNSGEIPWRVRLELTNQTELTLDGIRKLLGAGQQDNAFIMAWIFVVRRTRGDSVTFAEIADKWDDDLYESAAVIDLAAVEDDRPEV